MEPEPLICPICLHQYRRSELTRHHLIPKSRRGKIIVLICRPCHSQIHALFTEKELERRFSTIDLLLESEELQDWILWIRKRKPTSRIRMRTSHRKGRR